MYKRMHTRTRRLDITPRVKEEVWERDGGRCILCGTSEAAPNAHYIARSQGGLGIARNIVTLCGRCHDRYDNSPERPAIKEEIRAYLMSQYDDWEEDALVYRKLPYLPQAGQGD